jgi:hypothetical protein
MSGLRTRRRRGTALLELAWATPWLAFGVVMLVAIVDAGELAAWSGTRARLVALGGGRASARAMVATVTRYAVAERVERTSWVQRVLAADSVTASLVAWTMADGLAWDESAVDVRGTGVHAHAWTRGAPGPRLGLRRREAGDHRDHPALAEHWREALPIYLASSPAWRLDYEPMRDGRPREGMFTPRPAWEVER